MTIVNDQPADADDFIEESSGASDGGKVLKLRAADGLLDESGLPVNRFGPGTDGVINLNGSNTFAFLSKAGNEYTMTRDFFGTTVTIGAGCTLITDGFVPWANVELTGTGTLKWGTAANGTNASGSTAGTGGAANAAGGRFFANQAGADGSNNSSNDGTGTAAITEGIGTVGGNGGSAGGATRAGGVAGAITAPVTTFGLFADNLFKGFDWLPTTGAYAGPYKGGSAGGGGAGGFNSGAGGGGGANSGLIWFFARLWSGTFTISGVGGNGGNGSTTSNGGGGGGSGSTTVAVYEKKTWSGSYVLTGGSPGTDGGGVTTPATAGQDGTSYEIQISSTVN